MAAAEKITIAVVPVIFNMKDLAAAFTEWERRYREEPERFQSESERLAESPETYGDAAAPYLMALLAGKI